MVKFKAPLLEPTYEILRHYINQWEYKIEISFKYNKFHTSITRYDSSFPRNLQHHSKKVIVDDVEGKLTQFNNKLSQKEFEHLLNKLTIFSS